MMRSVSVIIPAYNVGVYLEETLDSVLAQTFKDMEVIIVDDGSTDNTVQIAQKYADAHPGQVKLIQQQNNGPAAARNTGIQSSDSTYIAFLDSDDLWVPGKLASQMEFFKSQPPEVGLIFSRIARFDNEGLWKAGDSRGPVNHSGDFYKSLLKGNCITTQTVVVKRSCFDRVGLFDTSPDIIEDYDMWLRIAMEYHMAYQDDLHAVYREHEAGRSKRLKWSQLAFIAVLQKHYNLNQHNKELSNSILETKNNLLLYFCKSCIKEGEVKQARELLNMVELFPTPPSLRYLRLLTYVPGFFYSSLRFLKRKMNKSSEIEKSIEDLNKLLQPE
ncbi:MAG: glycosyltransferase [Candidatus Thiodiazotropha sp.]